MKKDMKKNLIDDEATKHPFYSDWGIKQYKNRMKELERQEKDLKKRRKLTNGESVQEDSTKESGEFASERSGVSL